MVEGSPVSRGCPLLGVTAGWGERLGGSLSRRRLTIPPAFVGLNISSSARRSWSGRHVELGAETVEGASRPQASNIAPGFMLGAICAGGSARNRATLMSQRSIGATASERPLVMPAELRWYVLVLVGIIIVVLAGFIVFHIGGTSEPGPGPSAPSKAETAV